MADFQKMSVLDRNTQLLNFCRLGNLGYVKLLIENHANIYTENRFGETPLFISSQEGHLDIVKLLIKKNADVNKACDTGETPLYISTQEGHIDIVKILIEKNVDVNQTRVRGETPLYISSQEGHLDIVKFLTEKNADVNQARDDDATPLYVSSKNGHLDIVKILIEKNADVNQASVTGSTPLYVSSKNGHLDIVKILIEKNADVNQASVTGLTPLHISSENGHLDIVKMLVENNADVDQARDNGETPLYNSSYNGHLDIVKFLIEKNADVNIACGTGETPLFISSQKGRLDLIKMLIKNKANVNQARYDGATPLYVSAELKHIAIVKILIDNGADVNQYCFDGTVTALSIGSERGHIDVVKCLVDNYADIHKAVKRGYTSLMYAALNGHLHIVKLLVGRGAKVNAVDNEGVNSLMYASCGGHLLIVKYLTQNGIDIKHHSYRGLTAIQYASNFGHQSIIEYLLRLSVQQNDLELLHTSLRKGNVTLLKHVMSLQFGLTIDSSLRHVYPDCEVSDEFQKFKGILKCQIDNMKTCKKLIERGIGLDWENLVKESDEIINYLTYLYKESKDVFSIVSSESFKMRKIFSIFSLEISDFVISNEHFTNILAVKITDKIIGKGSFGRVKIGVHAVTKVEYAVKCIDLLKSDLKVSFIVKETENIMKLQHDNVNDFYGHKLSHENGTPFLYMITGLCREDLHKHFIVYGKEGDRNPGCAQNFDSSLQYFLNVSLQIFNGLAFIHSMKFVHKDIKLHNIFISFDYRVKIGDFGLSDQLEDGVEVTTKINGTPIYLPPEVHQSKRLYSAATDIFASGLVLFELWQGELYYKTEPFLNLDKKGIIENLKSGIRPRFQDNQTADDIKAVIINCWQGDHLNRPTSQAVCDDLWKMFQYRVGDRKPEIGKIIQFKPDSSQGQKMKLEGSRFEYDDLLMTHFSQMKSPCMGSGEPPLPISDFLSQTASSGILSSRTNFGSKRKSNTSLGEGSNTKKQRRE